MKSYISFLCLIIVNICLAQQDSNKWKTEVSLGEGFSLTTFLEVSVNQNEFVLSSPKNADKRVLGGFKSVMGRAFGKIPKKGVFLNISGNKKGDSLVGNARAPMLGNLEFKGTLTGNKLSGDLIKDNKTIGNLEGVKTSENRNDYKSFYPQIMKITQNNIYSKEILQTKEWKNFQKDLKNLCENAQDDIELFLGFNMLSPKLPFSHFNLVMQKEDTDEIETNEPSVIFEEKTGSTAYLKIKNFSSSEKELADIFPGIINKNYENLIIDLRDNGGGGIEAAFEFAKYIVDETVNVGYFVTNKLEYSGFEIDKFETLPETRAKTTDDFLEELKTGKGAKLVFHKPGNPVFTGKLYILTNNNTASTCEPIVYVLKTNKQATVIGERTAGAMLSAAPFEISGKYKLILPVADFYTFDGARLEGVGVTPNIETVSENALNEALSRTGN